MIAIGFNQKKPPSRTAVVAIDISKAFDGLIQKISNSNLHSNVFLWLSAYIHGRQVVCLFRSVSSKRCNIKSGVPQGGILSSTLFTYFVSDYPDQASIRLNYADDFYGAESSSDIPTIEAAFTEDLLHVSAWAEAKNLKLAPEKSSITLFTPWTRQANYHPQVTLNGSILPMQKNPR
jgi:hypothetical protein